MIGRIYVRNDSARGDAFHRVNRRVLAVALIAAAAAGPAIAEPTSTYLTGTPNRSVPGQTVTFKAIVAGGEATGTVDVKKGAKLLGSSALSLLDPRTSLAMGGYHTCALTPAGAMKCWAYNVFGQLGIGNAFGSGLTVPQVVTGLSSGVAAATGGGYHTCALTEAGGALCWGYNNFGQLGDGNAPADSYIPIGVDGLSEGVAAISGGGTHTCAVTDAGGVKCWGNNNTGQLGTGVFPNNSPTPADVSGLTSGAVAVDAGLAHTCAVTEQGGVKCWGKNDIGQLGNNDAGNDSDTPVDVEGLASGVKQVAVGNSHTCALTDTGGVMCWGYNQEGQLGNDSTTNSPVPVDVDGLTSGVAAIAAGYQHTCALTATGGMLCWGKNDWGQLGNNDPDNDSHTPVAVDGLSSGVAAIDAGYFQTCAMTVARALKCWGRNDVSQIGNGSPDSGDHPVPEDVPAFGDGTTLSRNAATVSTAALKVGKNTLTASYGGDVDNDPSVSADYTHVVKKGKTKTSLKVRPGAATAAKKVRLAIRVKPRAPAEGSPSGRVLVYDGREKIGQFKVVNGKAGVRLGKLPPGDHTFKAAYRGTKTWKKSKDSAALTVAP